MDARYQVAAFDLDLLLRIQGIGRGNFDLDLFGRGFADEHVVLALDVGHDGFVHFVAAHAHRARIHNARKGNDRHLRSTAADIHHHVGGGLLNGQVRADGCGHGLFNKVDLARAGADWADSFTARFSTWVMPVGTQIMMRGRTSRRELCTLAMK